MARMRGAMDDQTAFSDVMRDLLRDLGMGDEGSTASQSDDEKGEEDEEGEAKTKSPDESEG